MIGDLVAKLIAAGASPEVAAAAVAEAFAAGVSSAPVHVTSADESVTRRREKDRIRQQIRRDNLRTSADLRDNPQMSQSASLSKEDKKEEFKKEEGASRPTASRSSRGQRLPDDWAPTAIDHAISLEMLGAERSRSELEKFRDHWKQQPGSKGVKLDWDAAWRNWIRRAAEYRGGTNGNRSHQANGKPAGGSFFDGLRSLAADISGDDQPPGNATAEVPLGRFNIDG